MLHIFQFNTPIFFTNPLRTSAWRSCPDWYSGVSSVHAVTDPIVLHSLRQTIELRRIKITGVPATIDPAIQSHYNLA